MASLANFELIIQGVKYYYAEVSQFTQNKSLIGH